MEGCRILGNIEIGMMSNPDRVELRNEYKNESIEEVYSRYHGTLRPFMRITIIEEKSVTEDEIINEFYRIIKELVNYGEDNLILKVLFIPKTEIGKLDILSESDDVTAQEYEELQIRVTECDVECKSYGLDNGSELSSATSTFEAFKEEF